MADPNNQTQGGTPLGQPDQSWMWTALARLLSPYRSNAGAGLPPREGAEPQVPLVQNPQAALTSTALTWQLQVTLQWTEPDQQQYPISHYNIFVAGNGKNNQTPVLVAGVVRSPAIFTVPADGTATALTFYIQTVLRSGLSSDALKSPTITASYPTTQVPGSQLSIGAGVLQPGSVITADLADGAVTNPKVAAGAITTTSLSDLAVSAAKLQASAVGTAQLADAAVIAQKIANLTITGGKLVNGTISTTQISDGAISTPKLQANSVVAGIIAANAVLTQNIVAGAITGALIQAGAVTADKLTTGSIGIGGGGGHPGELLLFNGSGTAIGWIGHDITGDGAWFKTISVGGAGYSSGQLTSDASGNVVLRGSVDVFAGSNEVQINSTNALQIKNPVSLSRTQMNFNFLDFFGPSGFIQTSLQPQALLLYNSSGLGRAQLTSFSSGELQLFNTAGSQTVDLTGDDAGSGFGALNITGFSGTLKIVATSSTTANAGAITPPTQVAGYLIIQLGGTNYKVPLYNQ